jgi:thiol-disulfide isomerase/thioredoxin
MTDEKPYGRPRLSPRRVLVLAALSAGLALVLTLLIFNVSTPQATQCPAQPDRAAAIDSAATGELAALNGTGQGRSYAEMAVTDAEGADLTIGDFAGRKLLVNFWASWCIPCRAEMPALEAIAAKYNSDQFIVVPVNTGEAEPGKAEAFLAGGRWAHLPLYVDPDWAAYKRMQREAVTLGLPVTLLLDENGCEIAVLQGPAEWDTADGERVIEEFLAL